MANRALLVGINKYPSAPLQGCVNDVEDVANFLVGRCDFKPGEIIIITDERATHDNISDALVDWIVHPSRPGDRLFFHNSSHGTEMLVDGEMHDAICPVDFDFSLETALIDEDFREIFRQIAPGVAFNWVADSCFSGDLARKLPPKYNRGCHITPRTFPMPFDLAWSVQAAKLRGATTSKLSVAVEHLNGALISGCATDQTSADAYIEDRYNGACTYALLKALKASPAEPLTKIVATMNDWMDANEYDQDPQLKGNPEICGKPWLTI
ncbi:caspase family protein [Candidatus Pacearchaeota archaeon]|jgi:hypothetical protein|nr:caspase family protein [Candidatus Pacearchaeota archaeon]